MNATARMAAAKPKLNVQAFPRPPAVQRANRSIQIKWHGQLIVDTNDALMVLETHHPPTYYIPPSHVLVPLSTTPHASFCEWKGTATYYSIMSPASAAETVSNRIWSYNDPTKGFEVLKGFLAFYPGPWECLVDGERVQPQPGDFYGGWVTSDIEGVVKGAWGNMDPLI